MTVYIVMLSNEMGIYFLNVSVLEHELSHKQSYIFYSTVFITKINLSLKKPSPETNHVKLKFPILQK